MTPTDLIETINNKFPYLTWNYIIHASFVTSEAEEVLSKFNKLCYARHKHQINIEQLLGSRKYRRLGNITRQCRTHHQLLQCINLNPPAAYSIINCSQTLRFNSNFTSHPCSATYCTYPLIIVLIILLAYQRYDTIHN